MNNVRVLVCGNRRVTGARQVYTRLGRLPVETIIIEGGASGVDSTARTIAGERGWKIETYHTEWKKHGRAAGPIRNQRMLDDGKPDLVLAFPDSKSIGTWDMIRRSERAGIPVEVIML